MVPHRDFIIHGVVSEYNPAKGQFLFTRLDGDGKGYNQTSSPLTWTVLLELSAAATQIGANWVKLVQSLHTVRDSPNGLKNPDRIRNISIREWAYRVYQTVKRAICRRLGCHR